MATSHLQRAREEALKGLGDGEWLDNDTLIGNQLVFHITDIREDRGGGYAGADRWILRVEPYFEGEEDPDGLISMTDNPARHKFMVALDQTLNELNEKGDDPVIGPCVMVKLKGKNYRFNDIVDWDVDARKPILPQGAVQAGTRVEEEMRPRRPRQAAEAQPEQSARQEEAAEPQQRRPFAAAGASKAEPAPARQAPATADPEEVKEAAGRTLSRSTSSRPASTDEEFPSLRDWAIANGHPVPQGRGRYRNDVKAAYEAARTAWETHPSADEVAAGNGLPRPYQGSSEDVEHELAVRAAQAAVPEPADIPVGAPSRQTIPGRGEAPRAQEIRFRAGMTGTSIEACPACEKKIHDRIFPIGDPTSGDYALVHASCEAGGEQMMMPATPDIE
jgi:hypothetical protein